MGLDLSAKNQVSYIHMAGSPWSSHLGHFGALISALEPSPNYMSQRFAGQNLLFSFRSLFSQAFF